MQKKENIHIDKYRQRKRKKTFISRNKDNAKERKYSSPQIKTLQKKEDIHLHK